MAIGLVMPAAKALRWVHGLSRFDEWLVDKVVGLITVTIDAVSAEGGLRRYA